MYFSQKVCYLGIMNSNNQSANWKTIIASLLVLIGAIMFSTKAVMVKLAYRHDVDSLSLLALRMLFALPIYLAIGFWAMERLVLFIYPTLVVLISTIFLGKKLNKTIILALVLTYIGILIAFLENLNMPDNPDFLWGALFVFLAAFTYAIYIVGSGNLLPRIGTLRYTSIAMSAACISVLVHHATTQQLVLFHFDNMVYVYGFLMAIFATVLPSFLVSEGIRIIGANRAAIIGSIGPISTIILAYFFLGEGFGWFQILGTFLVIGGVLLISTKKEIGNAKDS